MRQTRIDAQSVGREAAKEAADVRAEARATLADAHDQLRRSSPKQKTADAVLKDADAACIEARETLSQVQAQSDDLAKAEAAAAKVGQAANATAKSFQNKIDQVHALPRESGSITAPLLGLA